MTISRPPGSEVRSRRPSRAPVVAFSLAVVAGVAAAATLLSSGREATVGISLAVCLGGIGIGLVTWARDLPIDHEKVQLRDDLAMTDDERADLDGERDLGTETVGRRPALRYLLAAAVTSLVAAIASPLRFLGPLPSGERRRTSWAAGRRVVLPDGRPVAAADGRFDQLATVFPENHTNADDSQVVLLRVPPDELSDRTVAGGAIDGWVAYSKICTHAGCSVGLFGIDDREPDVIRQLVCPCHQSVFDPTDGAQPVGGPAPRPLPQLPLAIDDEGYLIATADFDRPVGPGAWDDS